MGEGDINQRSNILNEQKGKVFREKQEGDKGKKSAFYVFL